MVANSNQLAIQWNIQLDNALGVIDRPTEFYFLAQLSNNKEPVGLVVE